MSGNMTPAQLHQAEFLLGPWLIGCFVDVLLQGVLYCQFSHYFAWHHEDKLWTRLMVITLLILTTLKTIHSFASSWVMFILNFQNLEGAILLYYTEWYLTGSAVMVATICVFVQSFFLHRLWVISKRNYWCVVPLASVVVFAYAAICTATYYISRGTAAGDHIHIWFDAHLSTVFAGDALITLSTAFFLVKSRKDVLPQTLGIIHSLIRLTFQTALPASLCAMFNLIFSQTNGTNELISTGFNQALPKLYAFSMMWTLNARRELRSANAKNNRFSTAELGSARVKRENFPLSPYTTGVHVQTQTKVETTTDIDVRGMFHKDSINSTTSVTEEDKSPV